jgi:LacI family transcriptional regulator
MSLKKIAKELDLSLTTVSRALNGYPEVALSTRQAVMAAAARLQYQPDARARNLALGRADAIGLIFPITPGDLGDLMFLEVAATMSERFAKEGLDLLIISATAQDEVAAYQRTMASRRVAGFIVPRTHVHDERLQLLQAQGMPFVAYGRSAGLKGPFAWVDFDNVAGACMATERLLGFGHCRIGYLGASPVYNFAALRFQGFCETLAAHGTPLYQPAVQRDALDRRAGYVAMQRLLALPEPPTAILVDNHLAGAGAVHAVLQSGLVPGRDLSLIIYDGIPSDSVLSKGVTAVAQPTPGEVGLVLAEMMLARLRGEPLEALHSLRMPVLVPGDSDGPVLDTGDAFVAPIQVVAASATSQSFK